MAINSECTVNIENSSNINVYNKNIRVDKDTTNFSSRQVFDEYFEYRDKALDVSKAEGEELKLIQLDVKNWLEENCLLDLPDDNNKKFEYYTNYSREIVENKFLGLINYLRTNYPSIISDFELKATELFIDSSFSMYFDNFNGDSEKTVTDDADGSFAFIVPSRMGRGRTEYGEEAEMVIPAVRYVPKEMRSQMLVGLPPFVIDKYKVDNNGRRGYLIFAPVTEDFAQDLSLSNAFKAIDKNVNAAVNFAHRRFGVKIIGLGAILPAYTKYGRTIKNEEVVTTTGHGGTIELIHKTINFLSQNHLETKTIGVLGLGSIGSSIAHIIADYFPNTMLNIYDSNQNKINRTVNTYSDLSRFKLSKSDTELIQESDIIVSAISGQIIDLDQKEVNFFNKPKIIIDDSQPGSVIPDQITKRGGNVLWVIGNDSRKDVATRRGYDYATLLNKYTDVFGCEAEVACINKYWDELEDRGMPPGAIAKIINKVAINGPVKPHNVKIISALFKKYGIEAAEPQVFGKPVKLK